MMQTSIFQSTKERKWRRFYSSIRPCSSTPTTDYLPQAMSTATSQIHNSKTNKQIKSKHGFCGRQMLEQMKAEMVKKNQTLTEHCTKRFTHKSKAHTLWQPRKTYKRRLRRRLTISSHLLSCSESWSTTKQTKTTRCPTSLEKPVK